MARGIPYAVALGLLGAACAQGAKMDSTDTQAPLEQAAIAAGWQADDIELVAERRLDHGGCRFHTALRRKTFEAPALALAVLPDGEVVVGDDDASAARVLEACGADAPADWWAEVVARFARGVGGKVVRPSNAADIEAIGQQGGAYQPPVLDTRGNARHLRFQTMHHEPRHAVSVMATLAAGVLTVETTPVTR